MQEINETIRFHLHNEEHVVQTSEVSPETTLLQYIRNHDHLKGTKYMCLEGGCGVCVVSITKKHPITKRTITFSVNSCLVYIYSCQGWQIQTVDGIGNKRNGYHPIQKVLADFNGTQCGFCSAGMVMNMYALYESNSNLTMEQIEISFGGNMCRCTGYRPILTAFKTLAKDADREILGEYPDIEDLNKCEKRYCQETCRYPCKKKASSPPYVASSDSRWFKVYSIREIFDVLKANRNKSYQLVAGNTARGVYPLFNASREIYIDITNVENLLNDAVTARNFIIGANKPLAETIDVFQRAASREGLDYLEKLANHIKMIAHVSVRNIGTLAGNLSIKHRYNEFPSDIFLIFETVGAKLTIVNDKGKEEQQSLLSYLSYDMDRKVIKNITLPKLDKSYRYQSYKFVLSITPDSKISPANKSGGTLLQRPISTGVQDFQTNQSMYPLTQPIPKLEALRQTSGETKYITDIPDSYDQLYAAFVAAKAPANSIISNVDPSKALRHEGVVAFYSAKDIPGPNTFIPSNANYPSGFIPPNLNLVPEELFCSGIVKYYFQPIGVVVAKSQEIAEKAADLVNVSYNPAKSKPFLTIGEILDAGATDRITEEASTKATSKGNDVKRVIKGNFDTTWQYHYHMETQICAVFPKEEGLDIYPGTQWMDIIQVAVANILNIKENNINIYVERVGGAFGAKITRNALISCATALAAYKLQKPVKMHLSFSANMNIIGKRFPSHAEYEVGLNEKGEIQYLNTTFYLDYANGGNEPIINLTIGIFSNCYKSDTWNVTGNNTKTDRHAAVWTRAPGHTLIMAMVETIMEHIAMEMNIAPLDIRLRNITQDKDNKILQFISECRQWSDYDNRVKSIDGFNKNNRWRKKGISLVPMTYSLLYAGNFNSTVAIYAGDGTVAVSHGGIEIGQGINTKVAQVCAYTLGIPLDMVSIKSSNNFVSANNFTTGGSVASEVVCYATLRACEILLERMKPIREKMGNPSWKDLVKECQTQYVELISSYMFSPNDPPKPYNIYGVCVTEVEVDILTGTHQINRVDLLEDTGTSMSPVIDIGQVEGAFVMGLGFWTTEKLVYDKYGRLLTNRTWNYKIPGALDIPIDFRVKFPRNNPNPNGVLHSKATAEPPLCLTCSIPIAIRQAVASARSNADSNASKWHPIDGPSDIESTFLNSLNDYKNYTL